MSTERKAPYNILSFLGMIVLTTLFGMGASWLIFCIGFIFLSLFVNRSGQDIIFSHVMAILELGAALGFVAGILIAASIVKANPETKARLESKFVTRDSVTIYSGAPMFVTVFLGQWFERLPRLVGESALPYVALGIFLAIVAISLFLYDYIPRRLVIPIGILGWLLTVAGFILYGIHSCRSWAL